LQENDSMLSEVLAGTTQGPTVTVVSEGAKATSQPAATSAGTSALPPWMSIVPSSAAQTLAVGSDCKSFATTSTLPLTLLGPSSSASREVPSSTSGDIVTSSISPSDPTSTVLAQRMEAGPSARNIPSPGVGVSTQALWAAANLQQTRQIGPSAAPMAVPEMALSASHWVQLLQFCKELEDRHQYWFAQKKESSWRLKRLEAKLEAEKMQQRKQKMEDVNASIATLRKEESQFLEGLEADYKEKILSLHREEERKDAKLVEMWTAKHMQLSQFLQQMLHEAPPSAPSQTHSGPGPSEQP
jgi:hypothetical protein